MFSISHKRKNMEHVQNVEIFSFSFWEDVYCYCWNYYFLIMTCRFLLYSNGIATAFFFCVLFFGISFSRGKLCSPFSVTARQFHCRGGDRFPDVHSAGIQSCMCRDVVIEKKREIERSTRRWEENNLWIIRPRELSVLLGSSPIFGRHCKRKEEDGFNCLRASFKTPSYLI